MLEIILVIYVYDPNLGRQEYRVALSIVNEISRRFANHGIVGKIYARGIGSPGPSVIYCGQPVHNAPDQGSGGTGRERPGNPGNPSLLILLDRCPP